jgi:hypothetical protein
MTPEVSLIVGGLPIAAVLFVLIEALKWGQFLRSERETRLAVIIVAVILGAAWTAVQFAPEIGPMVQTLVTALVGVAVAVVGYQVTRDRKGE